MTLVDWHSLHPWLAGEAAYRSEIKLRAALEGWRNGVPVHELALLNRLTETLARVPDKDLKPVFRLYRNLDESRA